MDTHILYLPDGGQVASGSDGCAIAAVTVTKTMSRGGDYAPGCVCAAMLEATILEGEELNLTAGDEVMLDKGAKRIGCFFLEKPTRLSGGRLKLTGYDSVIKLDTDISRWLSEMENTTLYGLARDICRECGLSIGDRFPNADMPVRPFAGTYTARQVLSFIAQAAGCFVEADGIGTICFRTPRVRNIALSGSGEKFYYLGTASREDYAVEKTDAVQLRLNAEGALYPADAENPLIIEGNPLLSSITEDTLGYLQTIRDAIPYGYIPGSATAVGGLGLELGDIITLDGKPFLVMEITGAAGGDKIVCTGSRMRNGTEAVNNVSAYQLARQAVTAQTQQEIFNKLTNNGQCQGLYMEDGQLYINASYLTAGIIDAAVVQVVNLVADKLKSVAEGSTVEVDGGRVSMKSPEGTTVILTNEDGDTPYLYMWQLGEQDSHALELCPHHLKLGGTSADPLFYLSVGDSGSDILFDSLEPSGNGNCKWQYFSQLGKYVLTRNG